MTPLYKLKPVIKDYIWGREVWALSANAEGACAVSGGALGEMSFREFCEKFPEETGTKRTKLGEFPVLVKLIEARDALSVQVHPGDEYAALHENGAGKTEMWFILGAEPGASLYLGFNREITREEFKRRIGDNTLTEVLRRVPVKAGDGFFIPAGTIHAIGAGIDIAEVQQNSATTYRVYDYGRVGADGKPRPLHIERALDVTKLVPAEVNAPNTGEYFTAERFEVRGERLREREPGEFEHALCVEGAAVLRAGDCAVELAKGEGAFVSAKCGGYELRGEARFILSRG